MEEIIVIEPENGEWSNCLMHHFYFEKTCGLSMVLSQIKIEIIGGQQGGHVNSKNPFPGFFSPPPSSFFWPPHLGAKQILKYGFLRK